MDRPALRRLADRLGILPEYRDVGGLRRVTSDATRAALISAMGLDPSTEETAERALATIQRQERDQLLAPVYVLPVPSQRDTAIDVTLPAKARFEPAPEFQLRLRTEDGRIFRQEGRLAAIDSEGSRRITMTSPLGAGYHQVTLTVEAAGGPVSADASLILTPGSCAPVADRLDDRKAFGFWTNLYAVRSSRNWGVGDLTDLSRLLEWTAEERGSFVGINPLHAVRNAEGSISPYGPVSRLFRNALYMDVEAVPELASSQQVRDRLANSAFQTALSRLRRSELVDYEGVMALKMPLLEQLHRVFVAERSRANGERVYDYEAYLERKGQALTDFATFMALEEHFRQERGRFVPWDRWPAPYRRPDSQAVADFRAAYPDRIDFHCFLQFELDRQLAEAARLAGAAGLPIGIYGDLAIGTSGKGSDPWAYPDLFCSGASVGAPPDDYATQGQNWGLPPIDPRALRQGRYAYWTSLLRNTLEHLGAVRLDHAMALTRLFWIPAGRPATEGAYVRYPADDLLGILALESRRNGTVIVGEDLGTVPDGFRATLARWGILSYQVLYFQRDPGGAFLGSNEYSPRALVTATTHDHPPLAGFWSGRDLEIRREVGEISDDDELEAARRKRDAARSALLDRLVADGLLNDEERSRPAWTAAKCAAVHLFLAASPSPLLAISLGDLAGETEPMNLPGVGLDRYPSWARRARQTLEQLPQESFARRVLQAVAPQRAVPPDG